MNQAPAFFQRAIQDCRSKLQQAREGPLAWLGVKARPKYDPRDQIPQRLLPHYRTLLDQGHVVWSGTVMVNGAMLEPGDEDLPGVSVYSVDPYFDALPQELFAIGQGCSAFKHQDPVDPEFKPLAERLSNEYDATIRMPITTSLTDGREMYLGSTIFHRARLPQGVYSGAPFPLVVAPQLTPANMLLPLAYWPEWLRRQWMPLGHDILQLPTTSTAPSVAQNARKLPIKPRLEQWDTANIPVRVTDAMARQFHVMARERSARQAYLFVGLGLGGSVKGQKEAVLLTEIDPEVHFLFVSNGIPVAIRASQRQRLRGTILDFQNSIFGSGLVIRLPEE